MDEALFLACRSIYRSDLLNNAIDKYKSIIDLFPGSPFREDCFIRAGLGLILDWKRWKSF